MIMRIKTMLPMFSFMAVSAFGQQTIQASASKTWTSAQSLVQTSMSIPQAVG